MPIRQLITVIRLALTLAKTKPIFKGKSEKVKVESEW
jgi:hypothetical protein